MKINVNEKNRVVSLWLGCKENTHKDLSENIKQELENYRNNKYKICIYQSGNDDLKINLLNLILNNVQ